jgi:GAF domain-containing protein
MAERFDYRGCWSFPIHSAAGKFVGSFAMYWRQPRQATARDLELASLLGGTASIIIAQHMESKARRQAEEALQQSRADALRDLESARHLQHISNLLLQPDAHAAMPEQVLDAVMAITRADFGSIQELNATGQLDLLAWRNFHPASAEHWRTVSHDSGTVCSAALERGTRVIVPDVQSPSGDVAISRESLREFELSGIRAVQSTPLVSSGGRIVGVFSSLWRRVYTPAPRELALLDILARQAADYFERRRA